MMFQIISTLGLLRLSLSTDYAPGQARVPVMNWFLKVGPTGFDRGRETIR